MSEQSVEGAGGSCGLLCQLVYHMASENHPDAARVMEEILLSDKLQLYVEAMQETFCPGEEFVEDESVEISERLKDALGELLTEILEVGVIACREQLRCLRALIRQPVLILELHTAIFLEGGPYWTERFNNHPVWKALSEQSAKPPLPPIE